jgi:DNA helicase HerA-like ATPase
MLKKLLHHLAGTSGFVPEEAEPLTIGGVPLLWSQEPLHLLLAGSTGTGKTTAVGELLDGITARGDRAVIVDPNGALRFPGLADVEALRCAYDAARSGQNDPRSAPGRGVVGPRSVGGRDGASAAKPASTRVAAESANDGAETHCSEPPSRSRTPYTQAIPLAAAAAEV